MKRWSIRILGGVALGFAATAVVAAVVKGIVPHLGPIQVQGFLRARLPSSGEGKGHLDLWRAELFGYTSWHAFARSDLAIPVDDTVRLVGFGNAPGWSHRALMPWVTGDRPWPTTGMEVRFVEAAGWPCRALWWEGRPAGQSRALHPIYLGFLADTGCYSAVWIVLLLAPDSLRRRLRHRRGRCPGCGYDLAGLRPGAACPECGKGTL